MPVSQFMPALMSLHACSSSIRVPQKSGTTIVTWLSRPIIAASQPDQLDIDQWPLAEALVEAAAQHPAGGVAQRVVVVAQRRRQAFHCVGERVTQRCYRRRA